MSKSAPERTLESTVSEHPASTTTPQPRTEKTGDAAHGAVGLLPAGHVAVDQ